MITNALDDKPLPIYGDGKQQRDWLHVEDNCRGILGGSRARAHRRGVQHRRSSTWKKSDDGPGKLLRLMGKPETLLSYVKDRPGHDRRYALHCDKMETDLGWKPAVPLEQGLRQTIDWYTWSQYSIHTKSTPATGPNVW
jgi:dTDP-glucose 4,6-dehydratase